MKNVHATTDLQTLWRLALPIFVHVVRTFRLWTHYDTGRWIGYSDVIVAFFFSFFFGRGGGALNIFRIWPRFQLKHNFVIFVFSRPLRQYLHTCRNQVVFYETYSSRYKKSLVPTISKWFFFKKYYGQPSRPTKIFWHLHRIRVGLCYYGDVLVRCNNSCPLNYYFIKPGFLSTGQIK